MSESQTPRCDKASRSFRVRRMTNGDEDWEQMIPLSLGRELESELAATRARLAELEGIAERLYKTAKELSKVSTLLSRERAHLKAYESYKEGKK